MTTEDAALPEEPTIAESGVPAYDMLSYFGVLAPAKTPARVVARLNAEINRISQLPEVRESYARQGIDPAQETPDRFRAYLQTEIGKWAKVVKETGARVD